MNPDLDLVIERVIRAPRAAIWKAWTTPDLFAKWWIPELYICRVESFALYPGGGFTTTMSEDGSAFTPHMDAAFLVVEEQVRVAPTASGAGAANSSRGGKTQDKRSVPRLRSLASRPGSTAARTTPSSPKPSREATRRVRVSESLPAAAPQAW